MRSVFQESWVGITTHVGAAAVGCPGRAKLDSEGIVTPCGGLLHTDCN